MKIYALLILVVLGGCRGLDRLVGTEQPEAPRASRFYSVACCMDNDGAGNLSYPDFLPDSHIQLCQQVKAANRTDQTINGDTYLATSVDCGNTRETGRTKIGDEFYAGKNY